MQMLTRIIRTATLAVFALLALAAAAHAGQYHVYTCRTPTGESAPADGWSGSTGAGGAFDDYTLNTCAEGGALIASLGDQTTHVTNLDRATWAFEAPAFDQVVGETLSRAGYLHGRAGEPATYQFWLAAPIARKIFDECLYSLGCQSQGEVGHAMASTNNVSVPTANLGSHLSANISCGEGAEGAQCTSSFGDANGYAAAVYLFAADITLEQTAGPSVSAVSGELAEASAASGTSPLLFTATDPGVGVYDAVFTVDVAVIQRTRVDENGGRCTDVGETSDGLPAFLYLQPCKSSVAADVGLDTTALANGPHHLVVSVLDAAGNSVPVLDRTIIVTNGSPPGLSEGGAGGAGTSGGTEAGATGATGVTGAGTAGAGTVAGLLGSPNGANASDHAKLTVAWKGTSAAHLTISYGRALTIEGRLADSGGAPIGDAQVEVAALPAYTGAALLAMAAARTGSNGRFAVRLPKYVSSRTLRFSYRAHLGDVSPAATAALTLAVRAGLSLSISPRIARVGRSISFHGRLFGTPVPRGGKQLVLEARSPGGRWIEFNVIRAGARGRFHARYRFRFPGPATYQFRARSEPEADYPYAAGASNTVVVHER